jgi:hypothetical protein
MHAKALLEDLEVSPLTPNISFDLIVTDSHRLPKPGETVSVCFDCTGPRIYVDAAWKTRPGEVVARLGLDIYLAIPDDHGTFADVLISASTTVVPSAIQAEAQALLLAAQIASSLMLQAPVFFTDCSNLARAVAAQVQTLKHHCGKLEGMQLNFRTPRLHCLRISTMSSETSMSSLTDVHIRPSLSLALGISVPAGTLLIDPLHALCWWRLNASVWQIM